jgi:hypothetical protein
VAARSQFTSDYRFAVVFSASDPLQFRLEATLVLLLLPCFSSVSNSVENLKVCVVGFGSELKVGSIRVYGDGCRFFAAVIVVDCGVDEGGEEVLMVVFGG